MKTNFFYAAIFGMMIITTTSRSQNVLFDGDFSQTTEIVPSDGSTPPINVWAYVAGYGSEVNPIIVDGVCIFQILDPGGTQNVQLAQWGFPLIKGHKYQLSFDIKADAEKSFGVYVGDEWGSSLIGYDRYWYSATTEWQPIQIDFEAYSVFDLHKVSFELGSDNITTYFDNIYLQDLGPATLTKVSLWGTLQDELGCEYEYSDQCDNPELILNPVSGLWEGSFSIPAGCYRYAVKETYEYSETIYGESGQEGSNEIQLYVPVDDQITFTYDPVTHLLTSTPYNGIPQNPEKVVLMGSLQNELGCPSDYQGDCDNVALSFNPDSGLWEGEFTLPPGCYDYEIKEISICNDINIYGENGVEGGPRIELLIPSEDVVTFSYDAETHVINTSPYSGAPQEVTRVFFTGSFGEELELSYNPDFSEWIGTFMLPAGCYSYLVNEIFGCSTLNYYGENGSEGASDEIELYIPSDSEMTFYYDPQSHIVTSSPYSGVPQEVTQVSLLDSFQNELSYDPGTGLWEGSITVPAGCYSYRIKETSACEEKYYGEDGNEYWPSIELYVPTEAEITFSYDPQTHIVTSSPYSGVPTEPNKVLLIGSFQEELGCSSNYDAACETTALIRNSETGMWEGNFNLPAGCYEYWVEVTSACDQTRYGQDGIEWGSNIELYVPSEGEITFSYDPATHVTTSTPYSGVPQELTSVSLLGSLQDELGCESDNMEVCDNSELVFDAGSGLWEVTLSLPAGCYSYQVQETFGCYTRVRYGENGDEWGSDIQLFVPSNTEITFSYDQQTHIISSTPNFDLSAANQCPETIYVDNLSGTCGAIVDYPEFVVTANCGGDIASVTQIEGLPSGSIFTTGSTSNIFELTKITGEVETCSIDVVVTDTEAPFITDLNQNYAPLWPPNHKMVSVYLEYAVSDNCDVASTDLFISSNEPQTGNGKGDQAPDWEILDEHNVLLRAERDAKGNGREYYLTIRVTDDAGNYREEVVTVKVPLNKGKATEETNFAKAINENYKLYPNPTTDVLNIKGPQSVSEYSYSIYDMLGVMKLNGTINNDMVEVNTLPSGTYVLIFGTDKGTVSKQFIKN